MPIDHSQTTQIGQCERQLAISSQIPPTFALPDATIQKTTKLKKTLQLQTNNLYSIKPN
jgi:hypothetical protein